MPILNTADYTNFEFFLFFTGCAMWVGAYGFIILNGFKDKFVEMPAVAIGSNFAWEAMWSWWYKTDMGALLQWSYQAWFFGDLFIVYLGWMYGHKQFKNPVLRKFFRPLYILNFVGFFLAYFFFTAQGYDEVIGANSAYIAQVVLSYLYIILILQENDYKLFSMWCAVLRGGGTFLNTIFMYVHYPDNHFVQTLGTVAAICDATTVYLLYRGKKGRPVTA